MSRRVILSTLAALGNLAVAAGDRQPIALSAGSWAGTDGNWSTVEFSLGSNAQPVNVLVATVLSEFWAVGTGGCYPNEPRCSRQRGGLYDPQASSDWEPLGTWQLSLEHLGIEGNGQYGFDTATARSDIQDGREFAIKKALMASINVTAPFLGQFGLAINPGNFGSVVAKSPLISAVESSSLIPSYSYGYTAGAHYRNMPVSVTLGGYDASRFVDHDTEFAITVGDNLPRTLVRGIEVQGSEGQGTPAGWESSIRSLSQFNDSFTALIDSSTPFVWLPDAVCQRFAEALNLTFDSDLDVYTVSDDQYQEYTQDDSYSFTFSLSDSNNRDNFGEPLTTAGVVNITVPIRAFIGTLQYPWDDQAIKYGDPAVPYFSIRRSGKNSTFIIGRSFLQEAYVVTKYDEGYFSIHQARFPDQPVENARIISIQGAASSAGDSSSSHGLGKGAIAGISVGAAALVAVLLSAWWFCRRRQSHRTEGEGDSSGGSSSDAEKSTVGPIGPRGSPIGRILFMFSRRTRPRSLHDPENEQEKQMAEAPDHEIYELPAPLPPAELNGDNGDDLADDGTVYGLEASHSISSYDRARLKMSRQLAGPVPEYSPPQNGAMPPPEKNLPDYEQPRQPSSLDPESPRDPDSNHGGSMGSTVSPLSPKDDWTMRSEELGRLNNGGLSPTDDRSGSNPPSSSPSRSQSNPSSLPRTPPGFNLLPTQRTPLNPSNIICMGPLPNANELGSRGHVPPQIHISDEGQTGSSNPDAYTRQSATDSLGTNFTLEEQERMAQLAAEDVSSHDHHPSLQLRDDSTPNMGHDAEPLHVPQLAERRFSWEEERES